MYYVYIIQAINFPDKIYYGFTEDLSRRLQAHNSGSSVHTAQHKPWEMVYYCAFKRKDVALQFERYLKTHSGRAFAQKRLW